MKLSDNEQRIINALLEDPVISNGDLIMAVYMSPSALNKAFKAIYAKFDIDGSGRHKRVKLIEKLKNTSIYAEE